jgi:hypothetical protein
MQGGGYCGTGGCDMMGECPVDSCDGILSNVTGTNLDEVQAESQAPSMAPTSEGTSETDEPTSTPVEAEGVLEGEVEVITDAPTSSPEIPQNATTPEVEGDDSPCYAVTGGCEDCLSGKDECAWTADKCLPSCMIADVSCFMVADFPEMKESEICAVAANTTDEPFTGPDAGVETGPCNGLPDCEQCLTVRMDCAWIADSCQPPSNCLAVADDECFHHSKYPNMTGPDICVIADGGGNATSDEPTDVTNDGSTDTEVSKISSAWMPGQNVVLSAMISLVALLQLMY